MAFGGMKSNTVDKKQNKPRLPAVEGMKSPMWGRKGTTCSRDFPIAPIFRMPKSRRASISSGQVMAKNGLVPEILSPSLEGKLTYDRKYEKVVFVSR